MKGWEVPQKDDRKLGNNLLIVDGMNLSFRYKHSGATNFAGDYVKTVLSLAKSYSCSDKIVLSDYKGSHYRKELYPKYKGNRDYSNQTDEEKEKAQMFFDEYNRTLEVMQASSEIEVLYHKGVEADDFMTVLVENLKDKYDNIWLISTDVDWDEMLEDNVHRFSYVSRKEFYLTNFFEVHGCDNTNQFVMMKCLTGDKSDNIMGVEGIGVKRAYSILRNYDNIFELIDDLPLAGKQKYIMALNESEELLTRNLELMDLKTFSADIIQSTSEEATLKVKALIDRLPSGTEDIHDLL